MATVREAQLPTSATGSTKDRDRRLMMGSITLAMVSKVGIGATDPVNLGAGSLGDVRVNDGPIDLCMRCPGEVSAIIQEHYDTNVGFDIRGKRRLCRRRSAAAYKDRTIGYLKEIEAAYDLNTYYVPIL
jgi:hypothetical protein